MATENLWGDLTDLEAFKTPKSILNEQAEILTEETSGLLQGHIESTTAKDQFLHDFDVIVPSLNHYVHTILRVEHDIELYPLMLYGPEGKTECPNEVSFKEALRNSLAPKKLRKLLSSLISQVE